MRVFPRGQTPDTVWQVDNDEPGRWVMLPVGNEHRVRVREPLETMGPNASRTALEFLVEAPGERAALCPVSVDGQRYVVPVLRRRVRFSWDTLEEVVDGQPLRIQSDCRVWVRDVALSGDPAAKLAWDGDGPNPRREGLEDKAAQVGTPVTVRRRIRLAPQTFTRWDVPFVERAPANRLKVYVQGPGGEGFRLTLSAGGKTKTFSPAASR